MRSVSVIRRLIFPTMIILVVLHGSLAALPHSHDCDAAGGGTQLLKIGAAEQHHSQLHHPCFGCAMAASSLATVHTIQVATSLVCSGSCTAKDRGVVSERFATAVNARAPPAFRHS